jgi:hypothetical protein
VKPRDTSEPTSATGDSTPRRRKKEPYRNRRAYNRARYAAVRDGTWTFRPKRTKEQRAALVKARRRRSYLKHRAKRIREKSEYWRLNKPKLRPLQRRVATRSRERNPLKHHARRTLNNALASGKVTRPDYCQICGTECIPEAHHPDYNQPLEVFWLCRLCHRELEGRSSFCSHRREVICLQCPVCRGTAFNAPHAAIAALLQGRAAPRDPIYAYCIECNRHVLPHLTTRWQLVNTFEPPANHGVKPS